MRLEMITSFGALPTWLKRFTVLTVLLDFSLIWITLVFWPHIFTKMLRFNTWLKQKNCDTSYHQFGGVEYKFGGKEVCHMHGNGIVDFRKPSSKEVLDKLCHMNFAEHHTVKQSNYLTIDLGKLSSIQIARIVLLITEINHQ